jgi:hypothetical protein
MLVMYNRYHNYAATQLRRINENGRFSVPRKYQGSKLEAVAQFFYGKKDDADFNSACAEYNKAWKEYEARQTADAVNAAERKKQIEEIYSRDGITVDEVKRLVEEATREAVTATSDAEKATENSNEHQELKRSEQVLESYIAKVNPTKETRETFEAGYVAAWDKLDDDLFNTARLITCE